VDQPAIPSPAIRAATADRERTVDVLTTAFVAGRLTLEEFRDRVGSACAARTYGDLAGLVTDIPEESGLILADAAHAADAAHVSGGEPAEREQENAMAAASMLFGCTQFLSLGLTTIPAIVCGHVALRQMDRTAERGRSQAAVGLLLGYFGLFWLVIMVITLTGAALHGS
jgi:hypothetical protein